MCAFLCSSMHILPKKTYYLHWLYAVYSQGNTIPAVVDKIHAKHTLIKAS